VTDPREHHVALTATTQIKVSVVATLITVTGPDQLPGALAQRRRPVVIENEELRWRFLALAYLQQARWWLIPILGYWLLSSAITNRYKLEADWHLNWKLDRSFDGKITLTPAKK
jgi:hypothetical protein